MNNLLLVSISAVIAYILVFIITPHMDKKALRSIHSERWWRIHDTILQVAVALAIFALILGWYAFIWD
jgi:quinol-cytochrome oxidoreductase complex cytochrome b subunit